MYYIYKITNLINNKVYIGQTHQTVNARWKGHTYEALNNYDNNYFHNAIKKYGVDNFKVETIDSATTQDEINRLEKYYIQLFKSNNNVYGYNISLGGETEAIFDYKIINDLWNKGWALREIAEYMGCITATVKHAVENNPSYSESEAKRRGANYRKIKQYDKDKNYIKTFRSFAEIARELNCSSNTISKCIRNKTYSALGFYWCFEGEELPKNIVLKHKRNKRGVKQYTLDNIYIQTFDTAANAARAVRPEANNNAAASSILQVCKGNRPTAYGYKWQYVEEDDKPVHECTVDQVK